jgi:GTPase Era involved in 16S rRNA processing
MSNNLLQPDSDALHQSAIDVITHVGNVMSKGCGILREHDRLLGENQGGNRLGAEIKAIEEDIRHVNEKLERVKRKELTMTIVAPTSAGKSTILNAIAGQDLLPSRNDATTVLPTEIVFSREVTRPKLILDKALMTLLREVWGQLHQIFQRIGLEEAVKQATKNDFPRENVIREILNSSSVSSQSEVEESNSIQAELIRINDLLRLCGIFGIATDFLSSLSEIPRIEVPFPRQLSSLKDSGLGTLALVDTPGPSEDKSLNLVNVVKDRLIASSLVLVVVDYTKIGQTDPAKVKKLVDEIAAVKGRDRIYIIVNKIDARDPNKPDDLTTKEILNLVKTKYEIDDPQNRVFEMSAIKGFLATNFQREKEIYQPTELRKRKSFEALGQKYYSDSWEDRKENISLSEMDKAANKYWQKSGFADFMEKAIAPLVPSIKDALNDISRIFTSFLSCLSKQKGILERDIQRLETEINQLEIEITAINSHITNISEVENIKSKAKKELNIILDTESLGLSGEIDHHANILLEKAINLYPLESKKLWQQLFLLPYSNYQMLDEISIFRDRYSTAIKYHYNRLTSNLLNRVKQIIEQINNDYSTQHELVLDNAQKRLHKIVRCDIKSDIYLDFIIRYEGEIYRLMESQDFVRNTSNGTNSMGTVFSHGEPSNTEHFITLSIEEYRWGRYSKSLLVLDDLRAWRGTIPGIFKYIGQNIICDIEKRLNEDIDAFIQQRDNLLREYKISLQFTIQTKKKIQNSYRIFVSQYSEFLGKTANLEKDLKYLQEYFKQH